MRGVLLSDIKGKSRILCKVLPRSITAFHYSNIHHGKAALSTIAKNEETESPYLLYAAAAAATAAITAVTTYTSLDATPQPTTLLNWSGTHSISTNYHFEPETVSELRAIIRYCHANGISMRPIGSALSPNAVGFHGGGMISMAHLDEVLEVDEERRTVRVQAGARVNQVIEALRKHNLTLPNLASIAEQQMGGFTQIGAHGTGAQIPPVDSFILSLTLETPGMGTLHLSPSHNPRLFHLAKVGLGSVGIVSEIEMQCVPSHALREHTFVLTREKAKERLGMLLKDYKHVRYMWIPYEDAVVVVTNDPVEDVPKPNPYQEAYKPPPMKTQPFLDLLFDLEDAMGAKEQKRWYTASFADLRDEVLHARNPLDVEHVKKCNRAEARFWKLNHGYQIKPSDELLQFDCGGQQWVKEICFPTGTFSNNNGNDMKFMEDLMKAIEENNIPAHSPIEQRWSASSSSLLSPAYNPDPNALYSWVGIIMYLPYATGEEDNTQQRNKITHAFKEDYCNLLRNIGDKYHAACHWGKLERPRTQAEKEELRKHILRRYAAGADFFNYMRMILDPRNLLSNDLVNAAFGDQDDLISDVADVSKDKK